MNAVTVVSVGETPTGVIAALAGRRDTVQVVRRCPALDELLAACQSGLAQVAVVAEGAGELTATLIDRLTAVGVSVVAVAGSAAEAARLKGLGAHPVSAQATPEALAAAVRAAVEGRRHPGSAGFAVPAAAGAGSGHDGGAPVAQPSAAGAEAGRADAPARKPRLGRRDKAASRHIRGGSPQGPLPHPPGGQAPAAAGQGARDAGGDGAPDSPNPGPITATPGSPAPGGSATPGDAAAPPAAAAETGGGRPGAGDRAPGRIVAVWGPIGSPGRTTVAMNLAAEEAAAGRSVMLIDADSYGASIAASLGLLDESASFAQACRSADQGALTTARLAKTATQLVFKGGALSLLTGLTRADRWPELRAAAVERVLKTARELAGLVVVDCGFALEDDEELSYDTVAPRRNAATLAVLAQADQVVAVGSGDPVGIPRLIRGLDELTRRLPGKEIAVVVNKVRRRAVGGAPEKALAQAWERFGPAQPISHFLPWDQELVDKALLEGRLLLELSPDAPLRRAIAGIGCAVGQQKQSSAVSSPTAEPLLRG
ncbi:MinD-like ATPase involved in chromosome partitioning or flagellar assembly [Arthrobacter stackebrandtii]|uniref:MinD-like ATPase involved in chromosome partitioning or flagellar assembly n=1 Tax=Arthrobacter stackebrandtii TaxID=272161 RepID=A0ABS4YYB1_9MICC|nr:chromosome partitioning protein [Arthrobacter stackebrandtii]MBP2413719.1 MinD-like ATPase involved in chromosome partitioning or flagellar assembly [Arthrobacter stackebrandtii]